MADSKISALTAATTLSDTDEMVLASAGASKKITGANLKASVSALTLLSSTTLGSNGTFDVSGISGSYNDLILMVIARGTDAGATDFLDLRFNNDASSIYDTETIQGAGSVASAFATNAAARIVCDSMPAAGSTSGYFAMVEILVPGYASTTWKKQCICKDAYATAAGGSSQLITVTSGFWRSTAAITRVQLFGNSTANLLTGSQLRIYGRL